MTSNIIKGIAGRFRRKQKERGLSELTWLQEKILKHQDDEKLKKHRFKTFTVFYKRPYELLHTYRELFENGLYKFQTTTNTPVIIDCGANIGLSVLYFKLLYPYAHVEAYEPDDQNFEILSRNCSTNRLQEVNLHKAAVWIRNGTLSFHATESEASHVSEQENSGTVQVASIRLADTLQNHPKIHFLKIDIEGAEWKVVTDIATELQRVDNLFLEYHGKAAETYKLNDIMGILKSAGFSVYIKTAADTLQHPFLEKSTKTSYDVQLNLFCYRS